MARCEIVTTGVKYISIGRAGVRLSVIAGTSLHEYNIGIKVDIVINGDNSLKVFWYVQP